MSDALQTERQLLLLQMLGQSPKGLTMEEMRRLFSRKGIDTSQKMLMRDIDAISSSFPVYEEKEGHCLRFVLNPCNISQLVLSTEDILSLHFLRALAEGYEGVPTGRQAAGLLERIIGQTPKILTQWREALQEQLRIHPTDLLEEREIAAPLMETIYQALEESETLEMEYYGFQRDSCQRRRVDPYLLEISEGCMHLIGWCHLRQDIQDFRVSRIHECEPTGGHFQRPEGFAGSWKTSRFRTMSNREQQEIRLKFRGFAVRYVREYEASRFGSLEDSEDGGLTGILEAPLTADLKRWILGFGAEAEVVAPEALRQEIGKILKQAAERY